MSNKKSEIRIRNNRIRRQKEMRRNFLVIIMTCCLVTAFSLSISSFASNAKDETSAVSYKYYKSITIENGDTLWSIATQHMDSEHYDSVNDYINEVKQMNTLANDDITYGQSLIIPYYSNKLLY